jgi:hypothetical protein
MSSNGSTVPRKRLGRFLLHLSIVAAILAAPAGRVVADEYHQPGLQLPGHGAFSGATFTALDEDQMKQIVQTAYSKLAQYTVGSGKRLTLELGPIETFQRDRFEQVRYLDIVDMPDGRVIDIQRRSHNRRIHMGALTTDIVQAAYSPAWRTLGPAWASSEWGREIYRLSVGEVLRRTGAKQAELLRVGAISAFTVTATLGGESRTYHAAFLWIAGGRKGLASFLVTDNIVQGVDAAARDSAPPFVASNGPAHLRSRRSIKAPVTEFDAACVAGTVTFTGSGNRQSATGHASGQHEANAAFEIDCSCNSDCSQSCSSSLLYTSCLDSGFTDECHKMASSQATDTDFSSAGDRAAPQCSAGFGCVEKSCLFCACGLSVSVSANGPSVSFSGASAADWDGSLSYSHVCPTCRADTPPPPPPTGGGGGGGGGGHGECDDGNLVTPEQCVSDCGGSVDGDYCDV